MLRPIKLKAPNGAHVGWAKKGKAPDPISRGPEVAPGEAADCASLPPEMRTIVKNKCPGVPRPGHLLPTTRFETRAKVFRVNLPGRVEKRAFSATDGILSPEPEFSALPHLHQRMQRGRADRVQANSQVSSAHAQKVLDSKGPIERLSSLSQSFIKRFNH